LKARKLKQVENSANVRKEADVEMAVEQVVVEPV
jgi:hypothetical protein